MKPKTNRQYGIGLTCLVTCRMTPAERASLAADAQHRRLSLGQQLRDAYLKRPAPAVIPEVNLEALIALSKLGSNLHQYVKMVRQGLVPAIEFDPGLLLQAVRDIKPTLIAG